MTKNQKESASEALCRLKSQILQEWSERARKRISSAQNLPQPILIDTLPAFMDDLADALKKSPNRSPRAENSNVPQEHGSERARLTNFDADQVIEEYYLLLDVIIVTLESENALNREEKDLIQSIFARAIKDAVTAYVLVHGRIRDQFVLTLTHDLRNPLGAAQMSADLIARHARNLGETKAKQDMLKWVGKVSENLQRIDRMVRDLLDVNTLAMGERLTLRLKACDGLEIVQNAIADCTRGESQKIVVKGDSASAIWDEELVRRAVENLIANAVKYGESGGTITITLEEKLGRVLIAVHNTGNVIPVEEQGLLFKAFRRSQSAKSGLKRGWGIGLSLVRGVAESHGGSIGMSSTKEDGTVFVIDMPADATPFQNAPVTAS